MRHRNHTFLNWAILSWNRGGGLIFRNSTLFGSDAWQRKKKAECGWELAIRLFSTMDTKRFSTFQTAHIFSRLLSKKTTICWPLHQMDFLGLAPESSVRYWISTSIVSEISLPIQKAMSGLVPEMGYFRLPPNLFFA